MRNILSLLFLVPICLFCDEHIFDLGPAGSVRYIHQDGFLFQVDRLSTENDLIYSHSYQYNSQGFLVSEQLIGDLGEIVYQNGAVITPYSSEEIVYDEDLDIIHYRFDDALYEYTLNSSNELSSKKERKVPIYDDKGFVVQIEDTYFDYNDKGQLITVTSPESIVSYGYNNEGFRISRTVNSKTEYFLYFGINEYGIIDENGSIIELRIPGLSFHQDILRPIAIETKEAIYAPIHDLRNNIVKLINIQTKEVISLAQPDPFGHIIDKNSPTNWIFSSKYYDPVTNLVYFGYRYYSPDLEEWLSPDPLAQSQNLYMYCLNNPIFYSDPDGRYSIAASFIRVAWGAGIAISSPILGPGALILAGSAFLAYEGSELYKSYRANQRMEARKEKEGKQKDRCPKNREAQQEQFEGALRDIERKIGKKLSRDDRQELHQHISGWNHSYHEIVEEGIELFKDKI